MNSLTPEKFLWQFEVRSKSNCSPSHQDRDSTLPKISFLARKSGKDAAFSLAPFLTVSSKAMKLGNEPDCHTAKTYAQVALK